MLCHLIVRVSIIITTSGRFVSALYNFELPAYDTTMSKAVAGIIQEFYARSESPLFLTLASESDKGLQLQGSLVNEILYATKGAIVYQVQEVTEFKVLNYKPQNNLFVVDGYESFKKIRALVLDTQFVAVTGYYLVVITRDSSTSRSTLQRMLEDFFNLHVVHVNILIQSHPGADVEMYTFFPFTEQHCYEALPILYNTFNRTNFNKIVPPFPSKADYLYGCDVVVITWEIQPHIFIKDHPIGNFIADGIDWRILEILSGKMNFTIKIVQPPANEERGVIYPNKTTTGAIRMMINGEGNLTIGAFGFTAGRAQVMASSMMYYSTAMVFALPATEEYTPFEKLFFSFKYIVWSIIGVIFVTGFLIIIILNLLGRKYKNFLTGTESQSPFLDMLNIFTGGSLPSMPERNFARSLLLIWLLATIILRTSYQGSLFQFIHEKQVKRAPETIKEVLAWNTEIYLRGPSIIYLIALGEGSDRAIKISGSIDDYFRKLQSPGTKATILTTNIQVIYYNSRNLDKQPVRILKERVSYLPMCIFTRKHSYLRPAVDDILTRLASGGIVDFWNKVFLPEYDSSASKSLSETEKISFYDIQGGLQFCLWLILISIVIFIFELISLKVALLRKIIDFFTY